MSAHTYAKHSTVRYTSQGLFQDFAPGGANAYHPNISVGGGASGKN